MAAVAKEAHPKTINLHLDLAQQERCTELYQKMGGIWWHFIHGPLSLHSYKINVQGIQLPKDGLHYVLFGGEKPKRNRVTFIGEANNTQDWQYFSSPNVRQWIIARKLDGSLTVNGEKQSITVESSTTNVPVTVTVLFPKKDERESELEGTWSRNCLIGRVEQPWDLRTINLSVENDRYPVIETYELAKKGLSLLTEKDATKIKDGIVLLACDVTKQKLLARPTHELDNILCQSFTECYKKDPKAIQERIKLILDKNFKGNNAQLILAIMNLEFYFSKSTLADAEKQEVLKGLATLLCHYLELPLDEKDAELLDLARLFIQTAGQAASRKTGHIYLKELSVTVKGPGYIHLDAFLKKIANLFPPEDPKWQETLVETIKKAPTPISKLQQFAKTFEANQPSKRQKTLLKLLKDVPKIEGSVKAKLDPVVDQIVQGLKLVPNAGNAIFELCDAYDKAAKLDQSLAEDVMAWFFKEGQMNRCQRFYNIYGNPDFVKKLYTEKLTPDQAKFLMPQSGDLLSIFQCFKVCQDVGEFAKAYTAVYSQNKEIGNETRAFLAGLQPESAAALKQHPILNPVFTELFPPPPKKPKPAKEAPKMIIPFLPLDEPIKNYKQAKQFLKDLIEDKLNILSPKSMSNLDERLGEATDEIINKMANNKVLEKETIEEYKKLLKSLATRLDTPGLILPSDRESFNLYYGMVYYNLVRIYMTRYFLLKPQDKKAYLGFIIKDFPGHLVYMSLSGREITSEVLTGLIFREADTATLDSFKEGIRATGLFQTVEETIRLAVNKQFRVKPTKEWYLYQKEEQIEGDDKFYARFWLMDCLMIILIQEDPIYKKLFFRGEDLVELYDEFMGFDGIADWLKAKVIEEADAKNRWDEIEKVVKDAKKAGKKKEENPEEKVSELDWNFLAAHAYIRQSKPAEYKVKILEILKTAKETLNLKALLDLGLLSMNKENKYKDSVFALQCFSIIKACNLATPEINRIMTQAYGEVRKQKRR